LPLVKILLFRRKVYHSDIQLFYMNQFYHIDIVVCIWLGLAILIQAKIPVRITLREPSKKDVFKGDWIKLKCEIDASAVNVSWHYRNFDTLPPITNSSNGTSIITWNKGNVVYNIREFKIYDAAGSTTRLRKKEICHARQKL
jgi:hypothetical protein